jgi:hypothetical protein
MNPFSLPVICATAARSTWRARRGSGRRAFDDGDDASCRTLACFGAHEVGNGRDGDEDRHRRKT